MPNAKDNDPRRNGSGFKHPPRVHDYLRLLLERFPHSHAVSLQLLERHEVFRDLCEEYQACSEVIERLTSFAPNSAMVKEYCALRLRLEGELLRYIAAHRGGDDQ